MNKLTALLIGTLLATAMTAPAFASPGLASPKSLSFGRQVVNACNTETLAGCTLKTLTLTNTTSQDVTITGTVYSDTPAPQDDIGFGVQSNSCITTLLPGQSCSIQFTANPLVLGKDKGQILVMDGSTVLLAVAVRTTGI